MRICFGLVAANVAKFFWAVSEPSLAALLFRRRERFVAQALNLTGCQLGGFAGSRLAVRPIRNPGS